MSDEQLTALTIAIGLMTREGIHQNAQVLKDLRTELSTRRTVSGQEAIGEVRGNGVQWFDQNPHAYPVGTKFYAAPIPATEPKEPK
jgi:hypothetical protein